MTTTPSVRVLAAVIHVEGRFLVCRRPAHKRHGGLWEFPGGKLEPDESDLEAARRELREELNVNVKSLGAELLAIHDVGSPYLIAFIEAQVEGVPECREHSELRWCRASELGSLDLAPSDRQFVDQALPRYAEDL